MKIIKTVFKYGAIASLALATTAVFAASPEYTYVEAAYVNTDFDGIGDDGGWGIGGSAEVGENIFIFADYSSIGLPAGVDFNAFDAGIGYKSAISPTIAPGGIMAISASPPPGNALRICSSPSITKQALVAASPSI